MTLSYLAVLVLAILTIKIQLDHPITSLYKQIDFAHYFTSSKLLVDGIDPYIEDLKPYYEQYGFNTENYITAATNPPGLIVLFAPLVTLSPSTAYWVWITIQQFCLLGVLIVSLRMLNLWLTLPPSWIFLLVLGAAVTAPNVANIVYGQTQNLIAFLIVMSLYLFTAHSRDKLSSYILGTTAGIKLFPAIFIYLVWLRGGLRGVAFWLLGFATMQLPFVLFLGVEPFVHFIVKAIPYIQQAALTYTGNISFTASLYSLLSEFGSNRADPQDILWYLGVLNASLLVLVLVVDYRQYQKDHRLDFSASSLFVALCVFSPTVWNHYLVLVYFPLLLGLKFALGPPRHDTHLKIACLLYLGIALTHGRIEVNEYMFAITALWGMVVNGFLLCWLFAVRRSLAKNLSDVVVAGPG